MNFRIELLPQLEEELLIVAQWYDAKSPHLGDDFLRAFQVAVTHLGRTPHMFATTYKDFRQARLRRFPYSAFYRIRSSDEIVVYALAHAAMNPETVREMLQTRIVEP